MDDFRVKIGFFTHPKTIKLARRLGPEGPCRLIQLWAHCAANRTDGDLTGMDAEDIAIAAGWTGDEDLFVGALTEVGFVDGDPGGHQIHDWSDHNAYCAGHESRKKAASLARKKQLIAAGRAVDEKKPEKKPRKSRKMHKAPADVENPPADCEKAPADFMIPPADVVNPSAPTPTPTPTPTPSPTPSPTPADPGDGAGGDDCLIDYLETRGWSTKRHRAKIEAAGIVTPPQRKYLTHQVKEAQKRQRVTSPVGLWLSMLKSEREKPAGEGWSGIPKPRPTTGWVPPPDAEPDYDKGLAMVRNIINPILGKARANGGGEAGDESTPENGEVAL